MLVEYVLERVGYTEEEEEEEAKVGQKVSYASVL